MAKTKKQIVKKDTKKTEKKEISKIGELYGQAKALREEIFKLNLENQQRKLKNTSSISHKKDELARLLTAIRQMELTK